MSSATAVSGRPTSPLPGQDPSFQCLTTRQAPLRGNVAKVGTSSRASGYPVVKMNNAAAPPPRTSREAVLAPAEGQFIGCATGEISRSRRNSGSPEPGSAARTGWNLGAGRRAPTGSDRVRPSPISTAIRAASPGSPPRAGYQAPPPPFVTAPTWNGRHSEQEKQFCGAAFSPRLVAGGQEAASDEVPEEVWAEFDASLNRLSNEAAFLRGMVKALRGGDLPGSASGIAPAGPASADMASGCMSRQSRWSPVPLMPRQEAESRPAHDLLDRGSPPRRQRASLPSRFYPCTGRENRGPRLSIKGTKQLKKDEVGQVSSATHQTQSENMQTASLAQNSAALNCPSLQTGSVGGC
eukprot:TRINITY_DN104099_c0_g1_i1.p1 TRINITY_DN104099_c0_g1~~TRINITY_DN104099_c0_g1_i1.p1  ORF type:complete len:364 (-),score=32.47 TRINITY_DN104099_c0_g1_i1:42-1097(-)